jgi:hypothetical protein
MTQQQKRAIKRRRKSGKKRQLQRERALPSPNVHAYTIPDAQAMGLPGRTKIYELINAGRLKVIKLDHRTMVVGDSLRELLSAKDEAVA